MTFAERGRRAPFSQVGDWVVVSDRVEPTAKAIYWALEAMTRRDHEDGGTQSRLADPSRETLAEMFGFSRPQSIDRYLDQLLAINAIDVKITPGHPSRYVVHQTPPDGYEGARSMGEWHIRRRRRKEAERDAAAAEREERKQARQKPSAGTR